MRRRRAKGRGRCPAVHSPSEGTSATGVVQIGAVSRGANGPATRGPSPTPVSCDLPCITAHLGGGRCPSLTGNLSASAEARIGTGPDGILGVEPGTTRLAMQETREGVARDGRTHSFCQGYGVGGSEGGSAGQLRSCAAPRGGRTLGHSGHGPCFKELLALPYLLAADCRGRSLTARRLGRTRTRRVSMGD